jgi:hypothetical protein
MDKKTAPPIPLLLINYLVLGEKLRKASKLDSAALCYEQAAEIWEKACPEIKGEKRKRFFGGVFRIKADLDFYFTYKGRQTPSPFILFTKRVTKSFAMGRQKTS